MISLTSSRAFGVGAASLMRVLDFLLGVEVADGEPNRMLVVMVTARTPVGGRWVRVSVLARPVRSDATTASLFMD